MSLCCLLMGFIALYIVTGMNSMTTLRNLCSGW